MFCPKLTVDVAGFLGFDPSIVLGDEYRYIQSSLFGRVPIDMVLFISNNLYGRGTVVRQVTLSKSQIVQALRHERNLNKGGLEKWLKDMDNTESIVVKDTWLDIETPHTEGMILNYLRLKGVLDLTTPHTDSELSTIERCHGGNQITLRGPSAHP